MVQEGQQPLDLRELISLWRENVKRIDAKVGHNQDKGAFAFDECANMLEAALLSGGPRSSEGPAWQPIATAPKDGTPFFVYWQKSLVGEPEIDKVAGWEEYQEVLSFGEPPATHWMALPQPPSVDAVARGPASNHEPSTRVKGSS